MTPQSKTTIGLILGVATFAVVMTIVTDKSMAERLKASRTAQNLPSDKAKTFLTESKAGVMVRRTAVFAGFMATGGLVIHVASYAAKHSHNLACRIHPTC